MRTSAPKALPRLSASLCSGSRKHIVIITVIVITIIIIVLIIVDIIIVFGVGFSPPHLTSNLPDRWSLSVTAVFGSGCVSNFPVPARSSLQWPTWRRKARHGEARPQPRLLAVLLSLRGKTEARLRPRLQAVLLRQAVLLSLLSPRTGGAALAHEVRARRARMKGRTVGEVSRAFVDWRAFAEGLARISPASSSASADASYMQKSTTVGSVASNS